MAERPYEPLSRFLRLSPRLGRFESGIGAFVTFFGRDGVPWPLLYARVRLLRTALALCLGFCISAFPEPCCGSLAGWQHFDRLVLVDAHNLRVTHETDLSRLLTIHAMPQSATD